MQLPPGARFDLMAIFTACAVALGAALIAQYGFGLEPCHLCTLQRMPYAFAALVTALTAYDGRMRAMLLGLCAAIFVTGAGLAFFHVGVEAHWWESACSGAEKLADSASGLLAKLAAGKAAPQCDSVPFELFGVSIAGMNVIASLILAAFAAWAARRAWRSV